MVSFCAFKFQTDNNAILTDTNNFIECFIIQILKIMRKFNYFWNKMISLMLNFNYY